MPAKYQQVAESLARQIQAGRIENGGRLPGEIDLARSYGVSRSTVRHALSKLQEVGLIETWTGAGSFVCYDGACLDADVGWSKALSKRGIETVSRVLRFERIDDAALAEELGSTEESFLALDRVRSAGGEAISLERSRLPWRPDFSRYMRGGLVDGSLQLTLEACGISPARGVEVVSLARLSQVEADLLGRARGDAFLATRRTVYTEAGDLVERVDSLLHPDHFNLQVTFGGAAR